MAEWPKVIKAMYNLVLPSEDFTVWNDELMRIRGVSDRVICDIIRWASHRQRSQKAGKPTLKEVRMWVYMWRKEDADSMDGPNCQYCGLDAGAGEATGWLSGDYAWENGRYVLIVESEKPVGRRMAIGCMCPKGKRVVAKSIQDGKADHGHTMQEQEDWAGRQRKIIADLHAQHRKARCT